MKCYPEPCAELVLVLFQHLKLLHYETLKRAQGDKM